MRANSPTKFPANMPDTSSEVVLQQKLTDLQAKLAKAQKAIGDLTDERDDVYAANNNLGDLYDAAVAKSETLEKEITEIKSELKAQEKELIETRASIVSLKDETAELKQAASAASELLSLIHI